MEHPVSAIPPSISPSSLASRVQAGDLEALGAMYDQYAQPLFGLAYRLLRSREDAQDVVHDVFVGLPEALRRYEERGSLELWLKRVTARVALNKLRLRRRRAEESIEHEPAPRNTRTTLDAIVIRDAVAALPHTLRAVFVLKAIEGFSHVEIGRMLDITKGASEVRLHRAIRALRAALETAS